MTDTILNGPDRPAAASLLFDLDGTWTDYGATRPVISTANGAVVVDMSAANRPTATGTVIDASTISVTFPDDATYTGRLEGTNLIRWSNGSTWEKVYTGPMLINLYGDFTDGLYRSGVWQVNGFIDVTMTDSHRPDAHGFAISASTILITFTDDATYAGRLQAPDTINWSNGTAWRSVVIR